VLASPASWLGLIALAAAGALVWRATTSNGARPAPPRPPGMVLVPAGSYRVGGGLGRAARTASLAAFYLDSTEVTVAAYTAYLRATGRATPWRGSPPPDWPATGVLWNEAQAFCAWRGPGGRLPTEDEWEAAARGPDGRPYPWGDTWQRGRANVFGAADTLQPVGGFPLGRSFVGAVDMIGNAWEWVADSQPASGGVPVHIIKGGAFNTLPGNATAIYRMPYPDDRQHLSLTGFRCARSLSP
jgi:formylglycine-generating enzyme required for sulfatase activity